MTTLFLVVHDACMGNAWVSVYLSDGLNDVIVHPLT